MRLKAILLLCLAAVGFAPSARGCTCFLAERQGSGFVGRNYDWDFSDGLVLVNPRGLEKPIDLDPSRVGGSWRAAHGSVTFNQYGRDFPAGGVNEKGLVVEVLWLRGTVFPPEDDRIGLSSLQWIQYQLDTSATVAEVIASLEEVRVTGTVPIHYFVADRTGAAASIEYLDGKAAIHRTGDSMPVPVLTNHTYEESEAFLRNCEGWGGTEPLPEGERSLPRFARAAAGVRALAASAEGPSVTSVFAVLESVSSAERTQWSIVYDLAAMRIHFRTRMSPDIRTIAVGEIDLACETGVRMIDIDLKGTGDLRDRWTGYTRTANRDLIGRAYAKTEFLRETPGATLDLLAAHPERARCAR